jgi:hypothetical protein
MSDQRRAQASPRRRPAKARTSNRAPRTSTTCGAREDLPEFRFATGGTLPTLVNQVVTGVQEFATGGIMPGYTPGQGVHRFSPTAGWLELSGGEPVLRPEAERVLGSSWVDGINAAARSSGVSGVLNWLRSGDAAPGWGHGDPPSPQAADRPAPRQASAKGGRIALPGWLDTALNFVPAGGFISARPRTGITLSPPSRQRRPAPSTPSTAAGRAAATGAT